ncbi:MAG: MMPL family transporter, partial [Planctomycetaceae bacterium]
PGPYRISPSTANSVLVDALTTILGFGALMIASHRGLESLGRLLTLGVTACTVTSLVFLPALLRVVDARGGRDADDAGELPEGATVPFPLAADDDRGRAQDGVDAGGRVAA